MPRGPDRDPASTGAGVTDFEVGIGGRAVRERRGSAALPDGFPVTPLATFGPATEHP